MGRRLLPVLALALVVIPSSSAADIQTSAKYVRAAIPAMEAWHADHGTYKGATLARLRRAYDRSLGHVRIRTATKRTYCVESTTLPIAHKAGPAAEIRTGWCGERGAPIGFDTTPSPSPSPPATAEQKIGNANPAIEAYAADHGGYAGMTVAALRRYDDTVADLTIVRATRDTYCVEAGAGGDEMHKNGPADRISPGPCPVAKRTLASASTAPGEGQFHPNGVDQSFARKAQLTARDFPYDTQRDPKRNAGVFLLPRCAGYYEPNRTDLVATGVAEAYFRTAHGAYYGSSVTVWRSHSDANTYWQRVLTARYPVCLGRILAAWHNRGVRTRVLHAKPVPARYTLGERRVAYEIAIRYTSRTASAVYVRAAYFFQNDRAIGVTMAGGVQSACVCTASLAGRVYARMRQSARR